MNSKYREFMQRQQMGGQVSNSTGDESMRQLFGDAPDNEKFTPNKKEPSNKKERNLEDLPIPVRGGTVKKGFIAFGVILLVEALFLLNGMNVFGFIGGTLMAVLSFLLAWKVQYRYTRESNFYFYHLTVTLRGVLSHYRATSILYEASEKIFLYSIGLMAVQHFLLSWFSLTSILYTVGYYGMFLGIILNLAKRKTLLLSKGLFLYSILLSVMTVQNTFGSLHYVNYHTVLSMLLFWYLMGLFLTIQVTELHIDEAEDLEIDMENIEETKDEAEDDLL